MNAAPSAGLAEALRGLDRDGRLLFATRVMRMFGYGFLAVVLALYLAARGFDGVAIGVILALTLVGDTLISLWLTTHADRYGRRLVLIVGALLMALAGIVFAATDAFLLLVAAAVVGVISPSGNEVGPFLAVEQAALSQTTPAVRRTPVFAWYNLAGSIATAVGSLAGGLLASALQGAGASPLESYRGIVIGYAIVGVLLAVGFARVTGAVEAPRIDRSTTPGGLGRLGLRPASRSVVLKLAGLFSIDAFGGGLVPQSLLAYWFHLRFGVEPAVLGTIFFGANILAAISSLLAARLAARIGLINTMVFTHIPSSLFLILAAFAPNLIVALGLLLLRSALSQMDVPTRTSYVMAVVTPPERAAAASVTAVPRSLASSLSPAIAGILLAMPFSGLPLVVCGVLKIVYDVALLVSFRDVKPPEERGRE